MDVGRDRAAAEIRRRHPDVPATVANNLVLLLAGSRARDGLSWPGVVWLEAHHGRRTAEIDRAAAAVIYALIAERRARPVNAVNDTHRAITASRFSRHDARTRVDTGATILAVASGAWNLPNRTEG